jgi:hypothetical protein
MLVKAGLDALAPAFQMLGALVTPLIPPIVVLGELFQALAPVIAIAVQAMMLIQAPLQLFAGPVMKALFTVLKFVSTVILTVVKAVSGVWNGIVGAVQSVLRKLADISILGAKPLGFLDGWADGLDKAKINTDSLNQSMAALNGLTWESAQEKAKETAEVVRNRKEMAKANEELSNVPSAWKVALRRVQAQDAQTGPGSSASMPLPTTAPATGGTWSGGTTGGQVGAPPPGVGTSAAAPGVTINGLTFNASNPAESAAQFEKAMDRVNYLLYGSRGRAGRYAIP